MIFSRQTLEKYADVMLWGLETARKGGRLNPYEAVMLRYDPAALPLAEAVHRRLLKRRLNVVLRAGASPDMEKDFYQLADNRQLAFVDKGQKELVESLNGYIALIAPTSLTHLKGVEPRKFGVSALARKFLKDIFDKREAAGRFSWTLCMYPTEELARQAGISIRKFAEQVECATFIDQPRPVEKWKLIFRQSARIKKGLNSLPIETLHIRSRNIDLKVRLGEKRRFVGISGHNIPSFEIFTSPDWRGTEGVYYSDLPSFRTGNLVKGVRLHFRKGRVVKVTATKGQEYVRKTLKTDSGACQLGEFSLTDRRFSRISRFMANTLFDENFGGRNGNCHLAVGSAYAETFTGSSKTLTPALRKRLGFNDSSVHWDLVNTEDKVVTAVLKGGETVTLYEKGQFRV